MNKDQGKYKCPICGNRTLHEDPRENPYTFEICSVCNIEFGLDDYSDSGFERELIQIKIRERFIKMGGRKFGEEKPYMPTRQFTKMWEPR